MRNSLPEIPFLVNEDVFISDHVKEWIVYNIHPNILRQIIFMNTNNTILLKKSIFFCIAKTITTMPSFHGTIICMCVEINTIDLRYRNFLCLVQTFRSTFYQRVTIIMTTPNDDGNFV